jgi:hypothetical protein
MAGPHPFQGDLMSANQPHNLRRSELVYNRYSEILAPGETLEDAINADKWVNVRRMLRVHDVIEVIASDGAFEAELRVTMINQLTGAIKFRVISHLVATPSKQESVPAGDRYEVKHAGHGKWRVQEKETGLIAADGLDKEGAEQARLEAELSRQAA